MVGHRPIMMWGIGDISFKPVADMTDDPVMTLLVRTPAGQLMVTGELVEVGGILVVRGVHVQNVRANAIGPANVMVVAQALMEGMQYDGLGVEGALRTTGANPDHRPRAIRFTRNFRFASV